MISEQCHVLFWLLASLAIVLVNRVVCSDHCSRSHCLYGREYCDTRMGRCLYGCEPGYVGLNCADICTNAKCEECMEEIAGLQKCTRCPAGFYGSHCNLRCSSNCRLSGDTCDQFGNCLHGCEKLYYGSKCEEQNCSFANCDICGITETGYEACFKCSPGYWWHAEHRICIACQGHCLNGDSDCVSKGKCFSDSCQPGWSGDYCTVKCQPSAKCAVCARRNGRDKCVECEAGARPSEDGGCEACPIPNNCQGECNATNGFCSNGCKSGFYGQQCDAECPQTCALTDTVHRECDQNTGYCNACQIGYYGNGCVSSCSANCLNKYCDKDTGNCILGCVEGYTGPRCGVSCSLPCAQKCVGNCFNDSCNSISHKCLNGCVSGWYGDLCDQQCVSGCATRQCDRESGNCVGQCKDGWYYPKCDWMCSPNCVDSVCDKNSGHCSRGCVDGFYGKWCLDHCLDVCRDRACDRLTGACQWCEPGLQGDKCDQACNDWRYGEDCKSVCGRCAMGLPCNTTTGHCPMGCLPGWMGIMCDQESEVQEQDTVVVATEGMSPGIQAAIASSVVGVVCCLAIVGGICWWKRCSRTSRKTVEEPAVAFSGDQATIETLQRPSTSILVNAPDAPRQSSDSDASASADLLGTNTDTSQIRLGDRLHVGTMYNIHRGTMINKGQTTQCCIKLYHLTHPDIDNKDVFLHQLTLEIEILHMCRNSPHVLKLLTTAQASDFYCIAMDTSLETGLLPYLHEVQTGLNTDRPLEGTRLEQLVSIAVDVCSAVKHIHGLKVVHRALRAGHVYLTESLVARLDNFDWAETMDSAEETIPRSKLPSDFIPWMAPECLLNDRFSQESDSWSLGMLLWEIFALGDTPYKDLSEDDKRQAISECVHPPKPRTANFSLYRAMKGCWRYDPGDRLSADQVLQQVQAIQVSMRLAAGSGHLSDPSDQGNQSRAPGQFCTDRFSGPPSSGRLAGQSSRGHVPGRPQNARGVDDHRLLASSCPNILGAGVGLKPTNPQIAQSHMNLGCSQQADGKNYRTRSPSRLEAMTKAPDSNKRLSLAVDTSRLDSNLKYDRPYQSVAGGLDRKDAGYTDMERVRNSGYSVGNLTYTDGDYSHGDTQRVGGQNGKSAAAQDWLPQQCDREQFEQKSEPSEQLYRQRQSQTDVSNCNSTRQYGPTPSSSRHNVMDGSPRHHGCPTDSLKSRPTEHRFEQGGRRNNFPSNKELGGSSNFASNRDRGDNHAMGLQRASGAQHQSLATNPAIARSCPNIAERTAGLSLTNRELARSYMDIGF